MAGFEPIPGETPIDPSGLRDKSIRNRRELNEAEGRNIAEAVFKYLLGGLNPETAPFDLVWSLKLHEEMFGNVWEWTADWFGMSRTRINGCCIPRNPRGSEQRESIDLDDPLRIPRKVIKGGSHLCAPSYCQRYRPAARYPQPIDTSTSHVGFRCV